MTKHAMRRTNVITDAYRSRVLDEGTKVYAITRYGALYKVQPLRAGAGYNGDARIYGHAPQGIIGSITFFHSFADAEAYVLRRNQIALKESLRFRDKIIPRIVASNARAIERLRAATERTTETGGADKVPKCPYPENLDATDGACPAFWRGQEHGVRGAVMRVRQALQGEGPGGTIANKELHAVCAAIAAMNKQPNNQTRNQENKHDHRNMR
jgi:hypothetical protein